MKILYHSTTATRYMHLWGVGTTESHAFIPTFQLTIFVLIGLFCLLLQKVLPIIFTGRGSSYTFVTLQAWQLLIAAVTATSSVSHWADIPNLSIWGGSGLGT